MTQELRGLSSRATRDLLAELATLLERNHGVVVRFESGGGVDVAQWVRDGERADLLVLADDALRELAHEGLVMADTVQPLFLSQVVLATPASGPAPPLATEDDLVTVLRGARRIAYSTGPSGTALLRRLDAWGLRDELGERLVQAPPGTPVASLLADGTADVGVQQRSEFAGVAGVRVVGPLPGRAAVTSTFTGGVLTTTSRPDAARGALDLLCSAEAARTTRAHGMRPAHD